MGDTSHIDSPRDLYRLQMDEVYEKQEEEKYKNIQMDEDFNKWTENYLSKQ